MQTSTIKQANAAKNTKYPLSYRKDQFSFQQNNMNNGVLNNIQLTTGADNVEFADDMAVIVTAKSLEKMVFNASLMQ